MIDSNENPFGMRLRQDTLTDLHMLGIADWDALDTLTDTDRAGIWGWGAATEKRFLARRDEVRIQRENFADDRERTT